MKKFLKENFVLSLAFALPIVFIAVVALSVYLPVRMVSTNYNFVYATCVHSVRSPDYDCSDYLRKRFSVVDGKMVLNPVELDQDSESTGKENVPDMPDTNELRDAVRIFLHDTTQNQSREITVEEAQALSVSGLLTSPDGVTVDYGRNRGADFFIFDGGYSEGFYLTDGDSKKKLNLINGLDGYYYYQNNVKFLGWVLP